MIYTGLLQVILFILLVIYVVMLIKSRLKPTFVKRAALTILAAGTVLYTYGFSMEPLAEGPLTTIARSLMLSLKMFFYNAEIFEMPTAQRTPAFLELYYFVFYAAVLTSVSAIIMLFGKRAMTMMSLLLRRKKFKHVFIGCNSRSESIARGIVDEDVAFIEFPSDKEEEDEMSIRSVLRGVAGDESQEVSVFKRRNVTVLYAKRKLLMEDNCRNVFSSIGLERLKKFIGPDTAFYLLSENTQADMDNLITLLSDNDLNDNVIHVCMPREGIARYYKTTLKRTGVHFIYPSSLAVVELMKTPSCHPAYVMEPVKDAEGKPSGRVSGGFNALVIGFGETGQAVTKFLYEFSSAIAEDGTVLPAHIIVDDERIDSLRGPFEFDCPDIDNSGIISYENLGTESSEFWRRLVERIDDLNYIAISMQDEAKNLDLACTIFTYAMKKRRNGLESFRIVIRKKYMLNHEIRLVTRLNEKAGHEVLVCYGEYEKIFTPDMIISKSKSGINANATSLANRIADAYASVSGNQAVNINGDTRQMTFHKKSTARMELHQYISRANHAATLSMLLCGDTSSPLSPQVLENLARTEHQRYQRYLTAHGYSYAPDDDDVMKTNHQICAWEDLSAEERKYHSDMILAQMKSGLMEGR